MYCILKPITKIEGIGDDEAIVFKVDTYENGEAILKVEANERIAIEIFDQYYTLLEEDSKNEQQINYNIVLWGGDKSVR